MRKKYFIFLLFLCCNASSLIASDNPFVKGTAGKKSIKVTKYPRFIKTIISKVAPMQHKISRKLDSLTKELKNNPSRKLLVMVIFVSFMFGAVHALGPGHGKIITFTYFLSKRANIIQGIIAGNLIAMLHVTSASIIVLSIYFLIKSAYLNAFENINIIIKSVSYSLIILLGILLFVKAFISFKNGRVSHEHGHIHLKSNIEKRSLLPAIFIIGIVPCPRTVIILLFSISVGVLKIGLLSSFTMAMGMAMTISLVGITAIFTKNSLGKLFSENNRLNLTIQSVSEMAGAILLILTGTVLFLLNI